MSVTYTAVLPAREHTVDFLTRLLTAERARRGTRAGTRAVPARDQAVLVLRWLLDGTRMRQLATDNQISVSTGYNYLHEGIDVLAARSPSLHSALLAAKAATKDYRRNPVDQQCELLSLLGDVAVGEDGPVLHLHAVLGLSDGTTRGGHLIEARVFPTLEAVVTETPAVLRKVMRSDIGIAVIDLDRSEP